KTFRLIALDMDGTLLRKDKTLHPDTAGDIAAASAAGIEVVYCTGRSPVELLPYREALPSVRYAVALSGACVCDLGETASGRTEKTGAVFERRIPQETVLRLVEEADRFGAMVHFLMDDRSVVRADLIPRMTEFHMAQYQQLYEKVATGVPDMTAEARKYNGVHKVNTYFRSAADRDMAYAALRELPLSFVFTEETMLEATLGGVSKAEGLCALARHLGIPMRRTMAVGDSENDLAALEAAGFSVAMGNAEKKVTALCDAVTDDNEHNGAGKAIRRYCLQSPSGPDFETGNGPDSGTDSTSDSGTGSGPVPETGTGPDAEIPIVRECCGVLLCGGKSRRMGRDKALLPWGNGTFLQAVANTLDMFMEKYLSVASEAPRKEGLSPDWIVLPDRVPDCGPIGGIYTALSVCSAEWAAVVSCDMPAVGESLIRVLMADRTDEAEIVYPVTADGRPHLTCALYRKSVLPVLAQQIRAGDYRLRALLDRCRSIAVPLDEERDLPLAGMLENINTEEDLERAQTAAREDERNDSGEQPADGCRDFCLWEDGIRIQCRLDLPDGFRYAGAPDGSCGPGSAGSCRRPVPSDGTAGESLPEPPKIPLLVIFHGFTGHMEEEHIRAVAGTANAAGFASLRADLYGHGRSGGVFRNHTLLKWIGCALTVLDYARTLPFVSGISLCGHSQGGLLVMLTGAMEQENIEAILPLSPAWMIPETARKGELLGTPFDPGQIPEKLEAGKGLCLGDRYVRAAQMIEVEPAIRRFRKPVLLVHGDADLSVPVEYSFRAAGLYADAKLVTVPGDTHCYDFHLDQVTEAVGDFLRKLKDH
ncbi:MAG: Cof-type HAD-IIB family hydrolase, partial [Eubacteriales bacterium]|nr:Cof-type HAD-IIB family hydrolase [Eubacteriales bacterium]